MGTVMPEFDQRTAQAMARPGAAVPRLVPIDADGAQAMDAAACHAVAYRQGLAEARVTPALRPADVLARFDLDLPAEGQPALAVIDDLVAQATDGIHGHASPRFFGYVCGGSMPVGLTLTQSLPAPGTKFSISCAVSDEYRLSEAGPM